MTIKKFNFYVSMKFCLSVHLSIYMYMSVCIFLSVCTQNQSLMTVFGYHLTFHWCLRAHLGPFKKVYLPVSVFRLSLSLYIYIYIYMSVLFCSCFNRKQFRGRRTWKAKLQQHSCVVRRRWISWNRWVDHG